MKKNNKSARGITLIALVVTIVVLLILAGITIMYTMGDNGIFNKAKTAKDETRAGAVQEERDMWKTLGQANQYLSGSQTESLSQLLDRLVSSGGLTQEEREQVEQTGEVTIGTRTIVFGKPGKTLVDAFKAGEIKVGDYVDYKPITGKTVSIAPEKTGHSQTQTYKVNTATTWRVLGLNEVGTELLITSGSPIKKEGDDPYLYLASGEGYTYAVENLDKISNIYYNGEYAKEARSIRMEDITHALGITIDKENNKAYKTADSTKAELPYVGFFGQTYTYKSGDYAPENYMGTGSKRVGDVVEGSAYMLPITEASVVEQESKLYEVLFKGTTEEERYSKTYWLASVGVYISGSSCAFFSPGGVNGGIAAAGGDGLFGSHGNYVEYWMAVRPVISLKSDITVENIKVINGTEEEWTTGLPDSYTGKDLTKGQVLE
jgi:Tfp pilus assembly protein PilE